MHELRTLFREPAEFLSLKEFRKKLKLRQVKANAIRGPWTPWPGLQWNNIIEQITTTSYPIVVGKFCPRQDWDEPDSLPSLPENFKNAFPRLHAETLSFHLCSSEDLEFNRDFGVWQAPTRCEEVIPHLLFMPCSAADFSGRRLGRGGGFYDRYLREQPNIFRIGVLHSDYVFKNLPDDYFHSGDQNLNAILTDSNFYFDLKEHL